MITIIAVVVVTVIITITNDAATTNEGHIDKYHWVYATIIFSLFLNRIYDME